MTPLASALGVEITRVRTLNLSLRKVRTLVSLRPSPWPCVRKGWRPSPESPRERDCGLQPWEELRYSSNAANPEVLSPRESRI